MADKFQTLEIIQKYKLYGAQTYSRAPIVFSRGEGVYVWDLEGNKYTDFTSASSSLNQGHCHPKIVQELIKQASTLTLTSNHFYNGWFSEYAEYVTKLFDYGRVLPSNSGVEAGDTACKLARKWGYTKKNIPNDQAKIVFSEGNYWGRTMVAISSSTCDTYRNNYGPFMPGFITIPFDDVDALEDVLENEPNVCAFMTEPILGNSGVIVPKPGYLKEVRRLCNKYNILWIDDEIQSGLGRTGKLLAVHHENVRPDIVCIGKSLSGGLIPVSAVLCDDDIMLCIKPGEHGSTYGGNPLSCKVALAALKVIVEEKLSENAYSLGEILKRKFNTINENAIEEIRGKGLFYAIALKEGLGFDAKDVCTELLSKGILAIDANSYVIRIAPPLIITENELLRCTSIIIDVINSLYIRYK